MVFGQPFVKRFALCYRFVVCMSCPVLSVCDIRALWPNGWMDQDETWRAGRPPQKGHSPTQFSAHICRCQMAAWIKMPLSMELGLGPGDFVLDGEPALLPKKGAELPPNFRHMFIAAKPLDGSRWYLARRKASAQATLC